MKKAIIYTFSGTGNTLKVSEFLKNALALSDIETEVCYVDYKKYKNSEYPSPTSYDIIGIAYPIYGFNAPYLVNRFAKFLEKATKGQQAFIIKTSGEPYKVNNLSSSYIKRKLKKKGYRLTYEKHYLMPYNIMFRYPDSLVKQMYFYAEDYAKISASEIANETKRVIKGNVGAAIMNAICKLVWIGGPIIGKTYRINKKKCTKCRVCEKHCPMHNIRMSDKTGFPKFGGHCEICMRCVMYCPVNAINAGIMNAWKVHPQYPFSKVVNDENLSADYVNVNTKGYFRHFRKFFDSLDRDFEHYGLELPRYRKSQNT